MLPVVCRCRPLSQDLSNNPLSLEPGDTQLLERLISTSGSTIGGMFFVAALVLMTTIHRRRAGFLAVLRPGVEARKRPAGLLRDAVLRLATGRRLLAKKQQQVVVAGRELSAPSGTISTAAPPGEGPGNTGSLSLQRSSRRESKLFSRAHRRSIVKQMHRASRRVKVAVDWVRPRH